LGQIGSKNHKRDLREKEKEHILNNKDIVLNKTIPNRSPKEWYADNASNIKEKYQMNKEKIKQYYKDNIEHYKEYYINNRENKIKYQREYNKSKKEQKQVHDKP
jgi:hypothetical protein